MIRILQFILFAFILFIIGTVLAFRYLVWWQALLVVFGIIFAIALALQYIIRSVGKMLGGAMTKALEMHASVLKGAEVEVPSVQPAEAPAAQPQRSGAEADEEATPAPAAAASPRAYYQIDVTITPTNPSVDPEKKWEPTDLRLVPADHTVEAIKASDVKKVMRKGDAALNTQVEQNGSYVVANDGDKFNGPQRLRLLVALPPDMRQARFRYLTELFGRIDLPAAGAATGARPMLS